MTSRVLVTGASGFVGRPTLDALLARGHAVQLVRPRQREELFSVHAHGRRPDRPQAVGDRPVSLVGQGRGQHLAVHAEGDLAAGDGLEFAREGAPVMDFVITVCDSAAGELCPVWPGQPITAHWSFADPAAHEGIEADARRLQIGRLYHRFRVDELAEGLDNFARGVSALVAFHQHDARGGDV